MELGDKILMLENTWYSVISPESCSSILWRSWEHKEEAAEALKLTADDMLKNKFIDKIINEPLGGAHYDPDQTFKSVKENILLFHKKIKSLSKNKMIDNRRKKFTKIGNFKVRITINIFQYLSTNFLFKNFLISLKNCELLIFHFPYIYHMENRNPFKIYENDNSSIVNLSDGKIPPQAIDLEEAVLGAMLIDEKGVNEIIDILSPEVFYKKSHQLIYESIERLFRESEPIDLLTVSADLKKIKILKLIGGDFYLINLSQKVSSSAHIEFHSRIILQKYIQRKINYNFK